MRGKRGKTSYSPQRAKRKEWTRARTLANDSFVSPGKRWLFPPGVHTVRNAPGSFCQGFARSVPTLATPHPP
jgi:hypothetical protein